MESLDTEACFVDDLLNFSSDIGEDEDQKPHKTLLDSLKPAGLLGPAGSTRPFQEIAEEELEWISNKDAFPAVESFVGVSILSENPSGVVKLHSPISVLEGSSISSNSNSNSSSNVSNAANNRTLMSCCGGLKAPRRARSKRRCRHRQAGFADITSRQLWGSQFNRIKNVTSHVKAEKVMTTSTIGRKCQHCGAEKTPQWRAGPCGPKTLCNACGVRYKSGRLVPEYRPASSPTFLNELHSNSHRKIMEMRRTKQMTGMIVKHPLESG